MTKIGCGYYWIYPMSNSFTLTRRDCDINREGLPHGSPSPGFKKIKLLLIPFVFFSKNYFTTLTVDTLPFSRISFFRNKPDSGAA